MMLPEAERLLAPVAAIDGFRLGCLIDASTGMVLASRESPDGPGPLPAAAAAADITNVLTMLTGRLATGERLEDVMVTLSDSFFMVRTVGQDQDSQLLLLVMADRQRTNLALVHRTIRGLSAGFAA